MKFIVLSFTYVLQDGDPCKGLQDLDKDTTQTDEWFKCSRSCPTCRKVFNVNPFEIDTVQLDLIKNAVGGKSAIMQHEEE